MDNTEFSLPENPILRTAQMIKAIHWYCGEDQQGSTHSTGKVLEWVAKTPLDDSSENLEAREELVGWMAMVAVKVMEPPFNDLIIKCKNLASLKHDSFSIESVDQVLEDVH